MAEGQSLEDESPGKNRQTSEQPPQSSPPLQVLSVQHYQAPAPSNALIDPENSIATTKEEEWVTKKKVELTTKRQIETRVKRQVVLEDGKVVEDSGPIVTTNTTEDTEKQESSHTEKREQVGDPTDDWVAVPGQEGVVREVKEKKVLSREEKEERVETEDVQHLGDISDDAYQTAVQSLAPDLRLALERSKRDKKELKEYKGSAPRIVHQSTKSKKVVDTEDSQRLSAVQPDGRIVTETRKTTEHEEIHGEEEPDARSGSSVTEEEHKESSQHFAKTKDQELVDYYLGDGVRIGGEMRYEAENVEGGRQGDPIDPAEWDSLSTRIAKMRRQKLLKTAPDGTVLIDRKDALTKRPLNFDLEEETRKVETSKWLENHFGSESQSSKDSIDDEDIQPTGTSTSFINVTMKSTSTKNKTSNRLSSPVNNHSVPKPYVVTSNSSSKVLVSPSNSNSNSNSPPLKKTSYYQGISEWKSEKEQQKEHQTHTRSSFSPPRTTRDRVQVLPTGPDHTFNKSPTPTPKLHSPRMFNGHNSHNGHNGHLNGHNGHVSPPLQRTERYTYDRYYERTESPSQEKTSSPFPPGIRSSPYDRSASPYTSKSNIHNGNGKTSSEEERERRSVSPPARPQRKYTNGHIQEEDHHHQLEDTHQIEESSRFIKNERWQRGNSQEPRPDYSPPRGTPSPPEIRSTPPPEASKKKVYQRTRFAADIPPVKPKPQGNPVKSSGGSGLGHSFRKLVGRLRSSSSERKRKQEEKQRLKQGGVNGNAEGDQEEPTPPPRHHRDHHNHHHRDRDGMPLQKFYLGEDPFGGSIYGRESEYRGAHPPPKRPHSANRRGSTTAEEHHNGIRNHVTNSNTLGRFSKSTSRLAGERTTATSSNNVYNTRSTVDYDRGGIQTLPRKLHNRERREQSRQVNVQPLSQNHQQTWETHRTYSRLNNNHTNSSSSNSGSLINVSIVNKPGLNRTPNGVNGPAKPARTYRSSLLRSKSFNVHAGDDMLHNSTNGSIYKSNPQLHRLDESPAPLKSPGIVTSISRSTKDLNEAVEKDDIIRKPVTSYDGNRFSKSTSHLNGYTNSRISTHETKKKIFMKGLMDRAPELYKTLHGNESIDENHRVSSPEHRELNGKLYTSTPIRNEHRRVEYSSSFRSNSPLVNGSTSSPSPVGNSMYTTSITHTPSFRKPNGDVTDRSVIRRGSGDDFSETVRITSKSDDPVRPSITNTVQSFSKKTIPTKGGRATETIKSSETKTITKSRYTPEHEIIRNGNHRFQTSPSGSGVVIEVRNSK